MQMILASKNRTYEDCRIAIVVSLFNHFITGRQQKGCIDRLLAQGCVQNNITVIEVPGAVEIPLVLKRLAKTNQYHALISLGCVIRGETSHYDYVCEQVSQGCLQIGLDYEIPVIFGVLTTENEEQALARVGGKHGHKGIDAADAALAMIDIMEKI